MAEHKIKRYIISLSPPQRKNVYVFIHREKEARILNIFAHDLSLSYDQPRFREDSEAYVAEQLRTHETFRPLVEEELSGYHDDWNQHVRTFMDFERFIDYCSLFAPGIEVYKEKIMRWGAQLSKLVLVPENLIKGKTLKKMLQEEVEHARLNVKGYRIMRGAVNQGKNLIDEMAQGSGQLSETVRDGLKEWEDAQGRLSNIYSRLFDSAYKQYQRKQNLCRLFYPNLRV